MLLKTIKTSLNNIFLTSSHSSHHPIRHIPYSPHHHIRRITIFATSPHSQQTSFPLDGIINADQRNSPLNRITDANQSIIRIIIVITAYYYKKAI